MVANLTRWTLEADCTVDPINASMYESSSGEYVKFEEAVEASSNSLQQLKAEIRALLDSYFVFEGDEYLDYHQPCRFAEKLRKLSAV